MKLTKLSQKQRTGSDPAQPSRAFPVFGNELMTGFLGGDSQPLSRITVASLADLGYSVNLAAADPYAPPQSVSSVLA